MGLIFENILYDLLLIGVSLLTYYIIKFQKKYDYFKERNIPYKVPQNYIRTLYDSLIMKKNITEINNEIYDEFPDVKYSGFFQFTKPAFMVKDPELIMDILIKDFNHFQNHGFPVDIETNPLDAHLFNLSDDMWRTMRHKLTPTFSSGKLKWMFNIMDESADRLLALIDSSANEDLLIRDIFARFSTDVIASCAFGIDADAINDPNCEFRKMAKRIFQPTKLQMAKLMLTFVFPWLNRIIKLRTQPKDITEFFISITKQGLEHRKKTGEKRTDFLQLLLELKEKGSVEFDTKELDQEEREAMEKVKQFEANDKLILTDKLLAAQVFVFFLGGFENTAMVMSFMAYFLASRKDIQDKLREEINGAKNLDYTTVKDLKLLDGCMREALRLYPPAETIMRGCNKTYHLGEGKFIEKDTPVIIPVSAMQKDAKYWEKPLEFYPERYLDGWTPIPGTYLPFSEGPRVCIAQRFALVQIKLAIAKVISKFEFLPSPKTKTPITLVPGFFQHVEGGLWVKVKRIS